MERYTISKSEKQTIYEIYRACRLCGAGGGYRMPIIQNIIDLDSSELELRQKIQECLQLEVRPDDRMPPLICELCVDKVNDFYQFLEMTRQTNIKTRTRLGLPIQDTKKGEPEQSNCILGVTEPVYTKDDEPPKSKAGPKCTKKIKKEPDVKVKIENTSDSSSRSSSVSSRASRRAPSPAPSPAARPARGAPAPSPAAAPARSRRSLLEEALARRKPDPPKIKDAKTETKNKTEAPKDTQTPKEKKATPAKKKGELESLLEDSMKFDDNTLLVPRSLKRTREEPPRPALLPKRANLARYLMDARIRPIPTKELLKEPSPPRRPGPRSRQPVKEPSPTPRPGPKSKKTRVEEENVPAPLKVPKSKAKPELPKTKEPPKPPEEPPPSAPPFKCVVCDTHCKNSGGFARHLNIHVPTFTKPTHACNPCGTWYVTAEEAASHHRYHAASTFPYHCRRCFDDFRTLQLYDDRCGTWYVTAEEAASHHRYHGASTFPYHCRRCFDDFRTLQLYDDHIESGLCVGDEPPSEKCEECLALFATAALRAAHRCPGRGFSEQAKLLRTTRPNCIIKQIFFTGKCSKCSRTYATAKTLKKHESQCSQKRKGGDLIADPDVLRRLKPMQVRITKCDGLLARETGEHYDVSRVKPNYGLAKNYIYPYMKLPPVKSEPLYRDSMVAIPVALKEEFSFTHWDSDSDVEESIVRSVPSLTTLAIKKLFTKNLLGKVPRKRKKVKNEAFDNENDFGDVSKDINDIINSLDDMGNGSLDRKDLTARIKDIIGCFDSEISENVNDKTANEQSEIINEDANVIDETIDNDGEKNKTSDESHCETVDGKGTDETMADKNQVHDTVTHDVSSKMDINTENDESTKENVLESNDNGNCEKTSNNKVYHGEKTIDKVLESNQLNDDNDNETINRLDSETNDHTVSYDKEIDISLQKSKDDEGVAVNTRDLENVPVNGINTLQNENSFENDTKINQNESSSDKESKSNDETKLTEEISKQINKESPIKHSIENLIGETDKNPEKYINEVISSIEELNRCHEQINGQNDNEINNSNLMEALDEEIGEKSLSDQDKITLEDLLPKGDTCEDLENISDDDFNFDA
ncbi:uncharacterized protein LOC134677343 [Cydia fagiglandana]|uniref:uncharacterized protein LOC134677343 n=1 Tax=Cydia fagiglandana TaxID=1458189 RepID=UPI002FEDEB53